MKILSVETKEYGHVVHIEHNGMKAYYFLEESFSPSFYTELKEFKKTFFDLGEEDWQGVMSPEDVFDWFLRHHTIQNDTMIKIQQYMLPPDNLSFDEAHRLVTELEVKENGRNI